MGDEGSRQPRWRKYPGLLAHGGRLAILAARRSLARRRRAGDYEGRLSEEARHWSEGQQGHTWLDSRTISDLVAAKISGDPSIYWLLHFQRKHASKTLELALNFGCGIGGLERNALSIGLAEAFDSFDISAEAIEESRRLDEAPGRINYFIADINRIELTPNRYDAAFAVNILHHLTALEYALDEVRKALKPGGLFVIHEYVGPARFQWTETQLEAVNEALKELPRRYRVNRRKGGVKRRVYRPLLDETNPDSPFEAARSDEIIDLLNERFECVERVDLGGALLHPLLEAIVDNFDESSESDRRLLVGLWDREMELMKQGILGSDFVYAVYRCRLED